MAKLRTKFIKDTDKQYSIREDGILIRHYVRYKSNNEDTVCNPDANGKLYLIINGKHCKRSSQSLLRSHFGFSYCSKCFSKIYNGNTRQWVCNECAEKSLQEYHTSDKYKKLRREGTKRYKLRHPERVKISRYKQCIREVNDITKGYVAGALNISVNDLTDELYEHHKNLIKLKRHVVKTFGISMNKLNSL